MKRAIIEIAGPFAPCDVQRIKDGFDKLFGEPLEYEVVENKKLIGGFLAKIDGKIYDASVATHLDEIDRTLTEGDSWI